MLKLKPPGIKKPNIKKNKKTISIFLVLFLLVGSSLAWFIIKDDINLGKKVYAQAAGHKIYRDEVHDLIGGNEGISDYDAAKVLADKYLTEALAQEKGITVTKEEIVSEYGKETLQQKNDNRYAYQNKINQLYFNKLSAYNRGIFKGKYLITHFSRHIPYESPLLEQDKSADPNLGNPKVIARDKEYAEELINRLHKQIQSGKITFEQAIKIENKDPVVGKSVYPTLTHSGTFDTTKGPTSFIDINSLRGDSQNLETGQTTKPFVVEVSNSAEDNSKAESYFLMMQLDEARGGGAETGSEEYINKAKERLEYEIYI